jgi:hypothetical protein
MHVSRRGFGLSLSFKQAGGGGTERRRTQEPPWKSESDETDRTCFARKKSTSSTQHRRDVGHSTQPHWAPPGREMNQPPLRWYYNGDNDTFPKIYQNKSEVLFAKTPTPFIRRLLLELYKVLLHIACEKVELKLCPRGGAVGVSTKPNSTSHDPPFYKELKSS